MPAARMAALFGTQYQNAALRVVPPSWPAFSSTRTLLPCQRLNNAVARPATPLPTTTISTSASNLPFAGAGAADLRAMVATHSSLILLQIAADAALESFNFRFL